MRVIVLSDRDGTLNVDDNYYLGSDPNWKNQVEIFPTVAWGIREINQIPDSLFAIGTNQAGVALQGQSPEGINFDNLTLARMAEVNDYIAKQIQLQGARIDYKFACPFVDPAYVEKARQRGHKVDPAFVRENHPDLKPNPGMIERIIMDEGLKREECQIFVTGDRSSDVEMALRIGGTGILIPGPKTRERGDVEKVQAMEGMTYIADDFLDAARYIQSRHLYK